MKRYSADQIHWLKNHIPKDREEYLEITAHAGSSPVEFPRTVYLEVGVDCNLDCTFCSKPTRRPFTRIMEEEHLMRVVDECAANGVYALYCHLFNEPLIHIKMLVKVIRRAKEKGIPIVAVTTNVTPLTAKNMGLLIEAGLDTLHCSFEGADHANYRVVRGADPVGMEQKIHGALAVREKMNRRNAKGQLMPWVAITHMHTHETDVQISAFLKKWNGVVDDVEIRPVLGFLGRTAIGMALIPGHRIPCRYLGDRLIIAADGTATGCSVDVDAALNLGNIIDGDTIRGIWHSDNYRNLWALHQWQQWHKLPEPCKSCDSWDFLATERSRHLKQTIR